MAFATNLLPAADKDNGSSGANWGADNYGSCSPAGVWDRLAQEAEGCAWKRDSGGADGGIHGATFYVDALPISAAVFAPTGGISVRSKWYRLGANATVGRGVSSVSDGNSTTNETVSSPSLGYVPNAVIDQHPAGRNWLSEDWGGPTAGNTAVLMQAARPTGTDIVSCDIIFVIATYDAAIQQSPLSFVLPLLFGAGVNLGSILGGVSALARDEMRSFMAHVRDTTRGRLRWTRDRDEFVLAGLREWRRPTHLDLGRRVA